MNKNENYLTEYMKISEELKHISNSLMRLQLLFSLYENDKTMKEINSSTKLNYSAISTNTRILELEEYIIREENTYSLSNIMRLYLKNLMEFDKTIAILKEFYNLFENHKVRNIPLKSISELHMVEDSKLIESTGTDIYKINEIIIDSLKKSNEIKAILPISFKELTKAIEKFINKGKKAELKISEDIYDDFVENIDLDLENLQIKELNKDFNFLLLISSDKLILGLYKKEGSFDQNRILLSKSEEALKWANILFDSI